MVSIKINEFLPDIYGSILSSFFEKKIPRETAATCDDCAMWKDSGTGYPGGIEFSRSTKCCTHYPNIPNYLVGGLLANTDPALEAGRQRIREIIKKKVGIMPQGIRRPEKYDLLLRNATPAFGKSRSIACPYYLQNEGGCSVRPFWNATCNTFFCKYSAGEEGRLFWKTLKKYLKNVEDILVQYSLSMMGWDPQKIIIEETSRHSLDAQDLDDKPVNDKSYKSIWGDWTNREEEFYRETYRLLSALTPEVFEKIEGMSQKVLLKELSRRYQSLTMPEPPGTLKRNPRLVIEKIDDNSYVLIGYSPLDPLEISKRVYDILDYFDGKLPNREVCRVIREQTGQEPDGDLLLALYQLRILVDPCA